MTDLQTEQEIIITTLEHVEPSTIVEESTTLEVLAVAEQGPPGPRGIPGPAGGTTYITVGPTPLSGHSVVACNEDGQLVPADSTLPVHQGAVLGLVDRAYIPGELATVQTSFVLEHPGWSWLAGPVFVGSSGRLAQVLPIGAVFSQVAGQALSATRILIDLHQPISIT